MLPTANSRAVERCRGLGTSCGLWAIRRAACYLAEGESVDLGEDPRMARTVVLRASAADTII